MIKLMVDFTKIVMRMPQPWPTWLLLLVSANLVAPLFFLGSLEARVALVGMMIGATLMMILFSRFGYVRLLGLGHIPWLFTVPWLWSRLGEASVVYHK